MKLTLDAEEPGERNETEADDAPDPDEIASDVVQPDRCDHYDDELYEVSVRSSAGLMN